MNISEDTIRRSSEGDINAFEEIYRAYSGYVYNVVFRIVKNEHDAQEVTQEMFITLYKKLKTFKYQANIKTWIYRMAVNMAINYYKKGKSVKAKTVEYNDEIGITTGENKVYVNDEMKCRQNLADKLLRNITEDQKVCVILRNIEGLSYKEIAETLNIDINAVRSRLKRAREKLMGVTANEMF